MNLLRSVRKRSHKYITAITDTKTLFLTESSLMKMTQLVSCRDLFEDRRAELAAFYGLTEEEAGRIESIDNKQALEDKFQNTDTDSGLLSNYRDAQMLYTGRMMMKYSRFPVAVKLIQYLNSKFLPFRRSKTVVLDYGCGVGDYGLAFATQGYKIRLCDIAGGNLDFAYWRFNQRKLPCDVLAVTEDNVYPDLGPSHIVIAGEVLEHVREPLTVLRNIHKSLPVGGYVWLSGYPEYEREVGGDHLQEAADVRLEALAFLKQNYEKIIMPPLPGGLFKKRKA